MSVPGIVQSMLDGEEIAARVSLGGDDELFVTSSSTLVYRADGLLSDESVEEFSHRADRITLSEGRRKVRFSLEYPLEGTKDFTVPASKTEAVLHPVLAGVLNGNGITETGETVVRTYRFSELTVIVTSERLVKHIGEAVWDGDFEEYRYEDVTSLAFEDGSVATQVVLGVDGRPRRIKAPNERADDLSERLKRALFAYHDVDSIEALNELVGIDDDEPAVDPAAAFGESVAPLGTDSSATDADPADSGSDAGRSAVDVSDSPTDSSTTTAEPVGPGAESSDSAEGTADSTVEPSAPSGETGAVSSNDPSTPTGIDAGDSAGEAAVADEPSDSTVATVDASSRAASGAGFADSGFEPATTDAADAVLERLEALEATVERQTAVIENQRETIEQLIEELRQGR